MRITVDIDNNVVQEAQRLTGIAEQSALINEAIRVLIAQESTRRLSRAGGTDRNAKAGPRRRPND